MVRASVPGGALSADQWRAIDHVADVVADGAVRLTSRGGVQLHFVRKGGLQPLHPHPRPHLVTTLAACGDVVRNVVACPAPVDRQPPEGAPGPRASVWPCASGPGPASYYEVWIDGEQAVSAEPAGDEEQPLYGAAYLPRKFKIGLAWPGDNCVDIYSHDLGLVPVRGSRRRRGLRRARGRRPRGQPRPARRHLPPPGRPARLGARGQRRGPGRGRHPRLPRPRQPGGPQAGPAQVRAGGARRRRVPPRGRGPLRRRRWPPRRRCPTWHQHDHLGWHRQDDGRWFLGLPVPSGRVAGAAARRADARWWSATASISG